MWAEVNYIHLQNVVPFSSRQHISTWKHPVLTVITQFKCINIMNDELLLPFCCVSLT